MNIFQYYEHIEEMEWAIEVCLETGLPVAASMCIGPEGDLHGVSSAECAVRMAKAGANVGKWIWHKMDVLTSCISLKT